MNFVNAATLVQKAQESGYAVPALNTNGGTYDITRAALEACDETGAPLIMQAYEPNLQYRGVDYFVKMARQLCDDLDISVPVALQMDHGHSYESVVRGMRAGLTSVMFDASDKPFEENVNQTREVVTIARALGVSVEAEIGHVKGNEPPREAQIGRIPMPEKPVIPPAKTKIEEAVQFAKQADVDMLAVSVGTTHGVYRTQNDIDFDLLDRLRGAVSVPLVQHGTSGISLDDLERLARGGMSKINFGEPFRYNYIAYFMELADSMEHRWHPWRIMQAVKERIKQDMKVLVQALGADGRA